MLWLSKELDVDPSKTSGVPTEYDSDLVNRETRKVPPSR